MKIRMMTFHTPKNYGAVLQAYALQTYLKKGYTDVKIIDYNTKNLRESYKLIPEAIALKTKIKNILIKRYIGERKIQFNRFDEFVKKYLDLTERFESFDELAKKSPESDIYVTGSDQVFNPTRREEERRAFYLQFGSDNVKRVAYAASFGIKQIPAEKIQEVQKYIQLFDKVSIREKSGVDMAESLGCTNVLEVVDPVFLLSKTEWGKLCTSKKPEFPYLLYYRLFRSKGADAKVNKLAKRLGLKIVVVSDIDVKMLKADYVFNAGPNEFLTLYQNAEFVVTNAFHGVAFSIIFRKQFLFCDNNIITSERGFNLMKKFNLEDRVLGNEIPEKINYDKLEQVINDNLKISKDFLETSIKSIS